MKHELDRTGRTAVLLDPHPFCHIAVTALLEPLGIAVAGAATSARAALALLDEHRPQLLVAEVDLGEGREEALDLLAIARRSVPGLTIIVLSACDDEWLVDAAFDAGASAYVAKTAEPEVFATAVRQAFEPSLHLARPREPVAPAARRDRVVPRLTRRELEILQLVAEGRSNRQVGQVLWVTDQTVKFHLANIYRKLGVGSRYEAARWAYEHGVLEVAESGEVVTIADGNGNATHTAKVPVRLTPAPAPATVPTERLREGTSR